MSKINIFWFRRDLRLDDNTALTQALKQKENVLSIFIFDKEILSKLTDKKDKRVDYFHQALKSIDDELKKHGSSLKTYFEKPIDAFKQIIEEFDVEAVFYNRDYEPYAIKRDDEIKNFLEKNNIEVFNFKDQVIFENDEIVKNDGLPYTVYTPYSKKWKEAFTLEKIKDEKNNYSNLYKNNTYQVLSLKEIGFEKTEIEFKNPELSKELIENYNKTRDFPALDATTRLGVALRFGTISVRKCVQFASEYNETWLNELIWREFFTQILYHYPKVVNRSFKEKYENIEWRNNEKDFKIWCEGKTGYPLVDAGIRELNETGFMHNRVRMVVASFLTKHLLIDWRWGEAYFAEKLLDYDLSSNNGNWQWAAGCGCDAAPYFRIFNPEEQQKKFDKEYKYINKWLPKNENNPPIVEHKFARLRALEVYKKAVKDL